MKSPTLKIFVAVLLGILCVGLGAASTTGVLIGAFGGWLGGIGAVLVISVIGFGLCAIIDYNYPRVWILWGILFGTPSLLLSIGAGFPGADPSSLIFWKSVGFVVLGSAIGGGYVGQKKKSKKLIKL